ncbi:LysR family transcriptional regulator [Actinoplanes philippinensis]|uniref:DNA-binding transcriptional regulator, LysR family n=1 Tax=Actinoplanes philippinensis TaxID=35752 RepID=A0A1I2GF36_9ACTN|nr:LysR family transcriptional regulator [Actinoplanes philippinensis]GIE76869.1 LysR family transcriptional regulator [Actinoplanes philippinensis]SFF15699.1 DNA-binding transcriptional regulator, LysR family [Actinoplanes philippinensis]
MDPHHLRLLRELGERGSVAAVARAMHITPSAVSQQLNTLQRTARVPLTERRGRRLVLTGAGRALAAAAVDVMTALDRAARAVGDHLDAPDDPVRVAAFHSAGLTWFAPLITRLAEIGGPPVRCADEDVAHADFPALVGDYDLVVAHRLAYSPPWPADRLTVIPLIEEPLYVAMSADHPLAARESLTAAEAARRPWVSVHEGYPLEGVLAAIAATAGRPLEIRHRINEFTVAASVVAAGEVLALLPGRTTTPDPRLALRPLDGIPAARHIDILTRPESLHRAAVRKVVETLRAIAA